MKPVAILTKYFNTANDPEGYQRVKASEFLGEIKELAPKDKDELVALAAEDLGVEVTAA